jgi:hypothetical protein
MNEKPTDGEIKVFLNWATRSCLCESYYSYQCSKCRDVAGGRLQKDKKILDYCLEARLIEWDSYHTLRQVRS